MKKATKASKKSSRKTTASATAAKPARAAKRKAATPRVAAKKVARQSPDVWLPDGLRTYAESLQAHGLLTGVVGKQRLSEDVASIFDALHRVLAGGKLARALKVKGAVNDRAKGKLDRLAKGLVRELNVFRLSAPVNVKYG